MKIYRNDAVVFEGRYREEIIQTLLESGIGDAFRNSDVPMEKIYNANFRQPSLDYIATCFSTEEIMDANILAYYIIHVSAEQDAPFVKAHFIAGAMYNVVHFLCQKMHEEFPNFPLITMKEKDVEIHTDNDLPLNFEDIDIDALFDQ